MKLTIILEKGDAALGTIDMDELSRSLANSLEEHVAEQIYRSMPSYFVKANAEEYGWEEGVYPRDFERAAIATIQWLLRNFAIGPKRDQIGLPENLAESKTIKWPKEAKTEGKDTKLSGGIQ